MTLPAKLVPPLALERHGWLEPQWEDPAEHEAAGQPRHPAAHVAALWPAEDEGVMD